ncbi:MAG: Lipopolysaccharide export system ATP-binding protein LptB [Anaerolineales bacterium]|nr:Lipopolysaccharide export system ATP-binding protein LptB [Anaerolineales bacterium]
MMLQVEGAYKSFGDFGAVNGANLTVSEGELVVVIGPNGAGKTTLFNLIAGQLKLDQGQILFGGENIAGLPPYEICERGIARSFQIANIFHRLTVFENVQVAVLAEQRKSTSLFRPAYNMAVEETNSILESVGLLHKAGNIAGALSHGDQRILEIAMALGNEPELLVLDEPTAGMSPEETFAAMELIQQLARERGITILLCEHDMDVVFSVAESIMVMHQGRTLLQDEPEAVRCNAEVQEAYLGVS